MPEKFLIKIYNMKRAILLLMLCSSLNLFAQKQKDKDKEEEKTEEQVDKRKFKENLFTGGTISLSFFNNVFLIGGNPVFGVSPTNFMDVGLVVNYNYTSYRDYSQINDKLRQKEYGGGAFVKLYPVRFLFVQGQLEHNWLTQKYIPPRPSTIIEKRNFTSNSFLVGGGYTTGREGRGGRPFYYLSIMFDVMKELYSPYTDNYGRTIPIIRGGIQIPLFQGKSDYRDRDPNEDDRRYRRRDSY